MIQISGQYCRKDFEFPRFLSFACIHWKSAGFYNFQSTHDCHKWPEPVVKFQSFMIATSVIYLLENHKLLHNSTIIPCTIVRSNMYPSRNRRISHTFTRLWLSQSACIRRKRQDFANPVSFIVTHCPCPWENDELCAFRLCHGCRTIRRPVSIGKPLCFAHFDPIAIDIDDHALWETGVWQ